MERNVFPTKEAGDYMNNRAVFVINDMAKLKGEEQRELFLKYNTNMLPTFILYNGDGVELSRFSGPVYDVKTFINLIEQELKPENYSAAREKRFKEDPSSAFDYISYLYMIGPDTKLIKSLEEAFAKMNDEERFSEKWIRFYSSAVRDIVNSPIYNYIYGNSKKVEAVMGEEKYSLFMKEKANDMLFSSIHSRDKEIINPLLKTINANPVMKTGFSKFIESNLDVVLSDNLPALINAANKTIKKSGSNTIENIVNYILSQTYNYETSEFKNKAEVMAFLENVIQCEKNIVSRQRYYETLDRMAVAKK